MPALNWRSPDRKSYKLNVPIDEALQARLDRHAKKLGIKKTELARNLLVAGLDAQGAKP